MYSLKSVAEHGAIDFLENVPADLNGVVGPDAQNVQVERRVMQLAQRKPVRNNRITAGMSVGQDVRRVEQLDVTQVANRALALAQPIPESKTHSYHQEWSWGGVH